MIVEIGHSLVFVYMLATAAGRLVAGDWWGAGVTLAVNVLVNACPVLIQRYNRIRLVRLFDLEPRLRPRRREPERSTSPREAATGDPSTGG